MRRTHLLTAAIAIAFVGVGTADAQTPMADLRADSLTATPASLTDGDQVTIKVTLRNRGGISALAFDYGFWLSSDTVLDGSDVALPGCTRNQPGLAAGTSQIKTVTCRIPSPFGIPSGDYYLVALVDLQNAIAESNEANNSVVSGTRLTIIRPIEVLEPGLLVHAVIDTHSSRLVDGTPLPVTPEIREFNNPTLTAQFLRGAGTLVCGGGTCRVAIETALPKTQRYRVCFDGMSGQLHAAGSVGHIHSRINVQQPGQADTGARKKDVLFLYVRMDDDIPGFPVPGNSVKVHVGNSWTHCANLDLVAGQATIELLYETDIAPASSTPVPTFLSEPDQIELLVHSWP